MARTIIAASRALVYWRAPRSFRYIRCCRVLATVERVKPILILATALVVVWVLYPPRQLDRSRVGDGTNVVEITYMGPLGPIKDAMDDAVREFERISREANAKDPRKPVYRVVSGQTAAKDQVADPTRFLVAVAGGLPPDVVYFDRYAIAEWAARGAFQPLDDYIAVDLAAGHPDAPRRDRFYPAVWDEAMYAGRTYGIPVSVDNRALLYNADLLIRAGLVDAQGNARPPGTWEELLAYAERLSERDAAGRLTRAGIIPDFGNAWLYQYAYHNDAEFISADGRTVLLNSPPVVEALEFMRRLAEAQGGYRQLSAFKASFQGDALDPFFVGKVAMKLDGQWVFDGLAAFARDVNFGIAPFPRPAKFVRDGAPPVSFCGGWAYAIPTTARNKSAAWEFIRFMTSERALRIQLESDRARYESLGRPFIPKQQVLQDLNEWAYAHYVEGNPQLADRFKSAGKVFNDLLPHSRFRPVTPVGQLLWNEQVTAMEAALYGALPAQKALDEGNAVVQRALDRFHAPPVGTPITSWAWFFAVYALLLLTGAILAVAVHLRRHPSGTLTRRQWPAGVICVAPWLIGFIIFGGGPMLFSLVMSFCEYDVLNAPRFTGLANYELMLREDRLMPLALWNTLYMVIAVPLHLAVSLLIALLLNQSIRAMPAWRTLFYLPAIVPMVASAVLWVWLLNPEGGLINLLLRQLGLPGPQWLQSSDWSKPALILMKLWAAGGGMIIWLAGLKSIPASLYEAAEVDGASAWQQFWSITIPQLTPYIFFNLIMGLIGTFQIFGEAFIMTQGGPVNSTLFYVYHLFNQAFRYGNMGYASAMAWVLFLIVLALTVVQIRLSRRWVHYESE